MYYIVKFGVNLILCICHWSSKSICKVHIWHAPTYKNVDNQIPFLKPLNLWSEFYLCSSYLLQVNCRYKSLISTLDWQLTESLFFQRRENSQESFTLMDEEISIEECLLSLNPILIASTNERLLLVCFY